MRLVETPPPACSACYQAKPLEAHVDFEAAWDGPTVQGGVVGEDGEVLEALTVAIDDLILCQECLRHAAGLVGMVEPDEQTAELEQLRASNATLTEQLRGLEDYKGKLEDAVAAKPELLERARRGRGRQPAGVS